MNSESKNEKRRKLYNKYRKSKGSGLGDSLVNLGSEIGARMRPVFDEAKRLGTEKRARLAAEKRERDEMRARIAALGGSALTDRIRDVGNDVSSIFNNLGSSVSYHRDRGRQMRLAREQREQAANDETVALRARLAALEGKGRGRPRKTNGGVLGIPNLGILDSIPNLGIRDTISPTTAQMNANNPYHVYLYNRRVEQQKRRERQERDDDEDYEMVELPQAESSSTPATGGFFTPMLLANAMGLNPLHPIKALRGALLGSPSAPATGGFFTPALLAANAMGINPVQALRGVFGFGMNNEIIYYPEDKKSEKEFKKMHKAGVKGGFLLPLLAANAMGINPVQALRGALGFGKDGIIFEPYNKKDGVLLKEIGMKKIRGGSQFWKDFGKGFSMVMGPASTLSGMAALIPPLTPFAAPLSMATGLLNSGVRALTGNGTTGGADPREYRRQSITARPEILRMANMRGIEVSHAKGEEGGAYGGYVHRPSSYHGSGDNFYASGASGGAKRSARAEIVKQVMNERGVSMIEASRIVKSEGLY